MKLLLTSAALALGMASAQQPGHQKQSGSVPITYQSCSSSSSPPADGCTEENGSVVLDSNWDWVHKAGDYTNCYTGDDWDKTLCPDPDTCSKNCALDNGDVAEYKSTYGISVDGNALSLQFVTGANVGSRTYLMDTDTTYKMFKLKNQEFTFDVDVSTLPCGVNGALYFVEMDADGGTARFPQNTAGAKYGTGYCDAQCPHDMKFISGEANILNWTESGGNTGTGHYGSCCHEMDIWESNQVSQAVTPHPCSKDGAYRCELEECGDGADRDNGVCDKDGCDLATYRLGVTDFYGPGSNFTLDSSQKFTVVTQFHTSDKTADGDLVEIRRFYVQNGKTIQSPSFTVGGQKFDSLTDKMCTAQKQAFGDNNTFADRGGLKAMGGALGRGMVLVMSLWDDTDVHMLWLDSDYPPTKPAGAPGVARGTCATTSGVPAEIEKSNPDATVIYSNIRYGDIGSTVPSAGPSPSSPSPSPSKKPSPSSPAPKSPSPSSPSPAGGNCPGGSLDACMDLCPASPPAAFKACVDDCVKRCTHMDQEAAQGTQHTHHHKRKH